MLNQRWIQVLGFSLLFFIVAILIRGLLSPAGHAAWTGLIAVFLLAAALHSLWDLTRFFSSLLVVIPSYLVIGGFSLLLLLMRLREACRSAAGASVLTA